MKFNKHSDPGHSWVKVPKSLLRKVGIQNMVSSFSYMKGDYAYLEEDIDFTLFDSAMIQLGLTCELKEHYTDNASRIRNYDSYVNYNEKDEIEIRDIKIALIQYTKWSKKGIRRINNASLKTLRYWKSYYGLDLKNTKS